jgi:aspartyl-tRNA(Asn)/glutamyl-tRNA(Gln) amidotransferase subunit A
LDYVVPAYYTIATAEASANLARFNGIRYGYRPEWAENPDELVETARDDAFGDEVKLRILLGTFVLRSGFQDQYYTRAQKIRTAIRNDLDKAFEEVGTIMMPVFPTLAFPHGENGLNPFQQKVADKFTATANLAGYPALSFPCGLENGLPVGMQFLAPAFEEERLFDASSKFEKEFPFSNPHLEQKWS